jgi:hypothetical protein
MRLMVDVQQTYAANYGVKCCCSASRLYGDFGETPTESAAAKAFDLLEHWQRVSLQQHRK